MGHGGGEIMTQEELNKRLVSNSVFVESFSTAYSRAQESLKAQTIENINELVYNMAKENGVSVYEVCANFVPEVEQDLMQPIIRGCDPFEKATMRVETTIKLRYKE